MKKMIQPRYGVSVEVDTTEPKFGFKAGDIITSEMEISFWFRRVVLVRGVNEQALCGEIKGEGDRPIRVASAPNGLILLERPSYKFKVGDLVTDNMGILGRVIVINPYGHIDENCLLVEFDSDVTGGHDAAVYWGSTWYPKEHKTDSRRRRWMSLSEMSVSGLSLCLDADEARVPELIQSQPVEDKWQGQKRIVERIFAELEARLKQGEYPVFEPQDLRIVDGEVQEIKSARQTRNLRECLRLFGATLFHLVNGESEFDRECYIFDPELAYRKKMPANDFGALVDELLFGKECTVEKIRGIIA